MFRGRNSVGVCEADDILFAEFWRDAGADAAVDAHLFGAARRRARGDAPAAAILHHLGVADCRGAEALRAGRRHIALCADEAQTRRRRIVGAARAFGVAVFLFERLRRAIGAAIAA